LEQQLLKFYEKWQKKIGIFFNFTARIYPMNQKLLDSTIENLKRLPENQLLEAGGFIACLLQKYDDLILQKGMQKLSENTESPDFVNEKPDLYHRSDLKEVYK